MAEFNWVFPWSVNVCVLKPSWHGRWNHNVVGLSKSHRVCVVFVVVSVLNWSWTYFWLMMDLLSCHVCSMVQLLLAHVALSKPSWVNWSLVFRENIHLICLSRWRLASFVRVGDRRSSRISEVTFVDDIGFDCHYRLWCWLELCLLLLLPWAIYEVWIVLDWTVLTNWVSETLLGTCVVAYTSISSRWLLSAVTLTHRNFSISCACFFDRLCFIYLLNFWMQE